MFLYLYFYGNVFTMKLIHYIILSIAVLASFSSHAQDTIRINPRALDSIPSNTYALNDTGPEFGVWLYNESSSQYSDVVSFGYSITSGGFVSTYLSSQVAGNSGISFSPHSVQIPPHDSLLMQYMKPYFGSPEFVIGSSTIVIWPVVNNSHTVILDSASKQIVIADPSGISSASSEDLKVFMSGGSLIVKNTSQNAFGDIRIFNSVGELLNSQKLSGQAIVPMEQYDAGVYIVEVILCNGNRRVYKIVNAPMH